MIVNVVACLFVLRLRDFYYTLLFKSVVNCFQVLC